MIRDIPLAQLKAKYENEHSRYIRVDGIDVHYRDEGRRDEGAPILLMIHGLLASLHTWDGWVEHLADQFRLIRMDVPGFGLTGPHPNLDHTPEYAARFCREFIEAVGITQSFYVAGSSLGGFVAWNYAVRFPESIERMVLLDPIGYPQPLPQVLKLVALPGVRHAARYITPKFMIDRNLREIYGQTHRLTEERRQLYYELLKRQGNRKNMVAMFQTLTDYSTHPTLKDNIRHLKVPTLLMWGELDRWVPVSLVDHWQSDVDGLKVKVYPGVGHIPMEEIPYRSAKDARQFLLA
ncbi:hypothetical protein GP5015_1494 [gamma proteobacterium HTCC5015]|nr:hypothetical protein GP5015_1494 [gamma proteobacterium HTCC5015]